MDKNQQLDIDKGLTARGFWGPRQETPEQIADKLVTFLKALDEIFEETLSWSSHELPGEPFTDPQNVQRLLADAFRKNTDAPHLGVTQAYDSHSTKFGDVSLSMIVGGYSDSRGIKNTFILHWYGAKAKTIAKAILRQIATVWDPDWGDVTSIELLRALADIRPVGTRMPNVGYLTYLSATRTQSLPDDLDKLSDDGVLGLKEGDGFLSTDKIIEYAKVLQPSAAFAPTPTTRSKL